MLKDPSLRVPIPTKLQYEYNQVFAGRNWNNGETVGGCCFGFLRSGVSQPNGSRSTELVLRGPGGSFYHTSWLMSTFCHEVRGYPRPLISTNDVF